MKNSSVFNFEITRRVEFDAGHRIPHHDGRCRHIHGHRYALEITVAGALVNDESRSDNGMIIDFQCIQEIARKHLVDKWDHAFLVYKNDAVVIDFLEKMPNHKTVVLDKPPTVENLAEIAFHRLSEICSNHYDNQLLLKRIRLYETPNCWADFTTNDFTENDPAVTK